MLNRGYPNRGNIKACGTGAVPGRGNLKIGDSHLHEEKCLLFAQQDPYACFVVLESATFPEEHQLPPNSGQITYLIPQAVCNQSYQNNPAIFPVMSNCSEYPGAITSPEITLFYGVFCLQAALT